jgi:hypothetical protein
LLVVEKKKKVYAALEGKERSIMFMPARKEKRFI